MADCQSFKVNCLVLCVAVYSVNDPKSDLMAKVFRIFATEVNNVQRSDLPWQVEYISANVSTLTRLFPSISIF